MNTNIDYYGILEVHPRASKEVIKKAYQTLAKKYHPDISPLNKNEALKKMTLLNEAFSVLSDDKLRAEYDNLFKQQTENKFSNSNNEDLFEKYNLHKHYEKCILIINIIKKHTNSFIDNIKYIYSFKYYILLVLVSSLFVLAAVSGHETSPSAKEKAVIAKDFTSRKKEPVQETPEQEDARIKKLAEERKDTFTFSHYALHTAPDIVADTTKSEFTQPTQTNFIDDTVKYVNKEQVQETPEQREERLNKLVAETEGKILLTTPDSYKKPDQSTNGKYTVYNLKTNKFETIDR